MKLIVNLPVFNEEENLGKTIARIKKSFENDFYSTGAGSVIEEKLIQMVDDGSTDRSVEVAKNANIDIIVSYKPNRKLAYAFKQGVESALKNGADFMVNIDADGQFNPKDIPNILAPVIKEDADMVVASRFGKYKPENMPRSKYFLNRFAARIIGFFLNQKIDDLTCGFRAHNAETLLKLNLTNLHYTYTQETIIDAIGKNLILKWVPVKVTYFSDRKSRIVGSLWKFISNSSKVILKAIRDVRPLKFFGWPGLLFSLIGVVGFTIFLINYFPEFKITPYINLVVFSSFSLILGIQLLIFALVADMIKTNRQLTEDSIYRRRKDQYLERKKKLSL